MQISDQKASTLTIERWLPHIAHYKTIPYIHMQVQIGSLYWSIFRQLERQPANYKMIDSWRRNSTILILCKNTKSANLVSKNKL